MEQPCNPEDLIEYYTLASRYDTSKGWHYIRYHSSTLNKFSASATVVLSFAAGAGAGTAVVKRGVFGHRGGMVLATATGLAMGLATGVAAYHVVPYVSSRLSDYDRWNAISAAEAITRAAVNHLRSDPQMQPHVCPLLKDFPNDPVEAPDRVMYSLTELQKLPIDEEGKVKSPVTGAKFWMAECQARPLSRMAVLQAQLKSIQDLLKDEKIDTQPAVRESLNNGRIAAIIDLEEECRKILSSSKKGAKDGALY